MATERKTINKEYYAAQLLAEQGMTLAAKETDNLKREGRSFVRPSLFKYGIILFLAVLADTVIILSYYLFGAGFFFGFIFASPFTVSILLISWLNDTKLKNAHNYVDQAKTKINQINARLTTATRANPKTAKFLRKFESTKGISRAIPRAMVRIRRFAHKSPLTRILLGSAGNAVSVLNLLPWQTISIFMAYSAEKSAYGAAKEVADELSV